MSTGFNLEKMTCKIGKNADKSDCAKKDCDNCRHWIKTTVWQDCLKCKNDCLDCPTGKGRK